MLGTSVFEKAVGLLNVIAVLPVCCSHSAAEIANKRIIMFSYGSGLASSMFSLRVSSDGAAGSVLDRLLKSLSDVPSRLDSRMKVEPSEFASIMKLREDTHHCGEALFACLFTDK